MNSDIERYTPAMPALVQRATECAKALGFPLMPEGRPPGYQGPPSVCIPAVGRLLQALAASKPGGRVGEHGTGPGVSTAWLLSGVGPEGKLISAEQDENLAESAAKLFEDDSRVEIRHGRWQEVLAAEPPFDLLFMDADPHQYLASADWEQVMEFVVVGGVIVFDDLCPVELWPEEWQGQTDHKREFAFHNSRVIGLEIRTTPITSALVVTRMK